MQLARVKDIVVSSTDPDAPKDQAAVFGNVFSENWLIGAPLDEPLFIIVEMPHKEIVYQIDHRPLS